MAHLRDLIFQDILENEAKGHQKLQIVAVKPFHLVLEQSGKETKPELNRWKINQKKGPNEIHALAVGAMVVVSRCYVFQQKLEFFVVEARHIKQSSLDVHCN